MLIDEYTYEPTSGGSILKVTSDSIKIGEGYLHLTLRRRALYLGKVWTESGPVLAFEMDPTGLDRSAPDRSIKKQ